MKAAAKTKPALLWDRVDTARKGAGVSEDDVPAGAFTIKQYAQKYGLTYSGADTQLQALADRGVFKTGKKYSTARGGKRMRNAVLLAIMNKLFEEALRCSNASGGTVGQTMPSTASTRSAGTPASDAAIKDLWPCFVAEVHRRLEVGARAYGDASFELPAGRLAVEIEQEMFDVMGWGFILWARVQALKARLAAMEAAALPVASTQGTLEPVGGDWRNQESPAAGAQDRETGAQ